MQILHACSVSFEQHEQSMTKLQFWMHDCVLKVKQMHDCVLKIKQALDMK